MPVLIDTNFLLALVFPRDINHAKARLAMRSLDDVRVVPAPVLPELFYMATQRMNYAGAITAFTLVRKGGFTMASLTDDDMERMDEIMTKYADNAFDFVDVATMALAERLNITEIYTFDRRDFRVFRPNHCAYFDLFP